VDALTLLPAPRVNCKRYSHHRTAYYLFELTLWLSVTFTTATTESAPFTGLALGVPSRTTSRSRTATRTTVLLLVTGTRTLVPLGRWMLTSRGRVRWRGGRSRGLRLEADRSTLS
jgi:hypothetical protein